MFVPMTITLVVVLCLEFLDTVTTPMLKRKNAEHIIKNISNPMGGKKLVAFSHLALLQ